MIDARHIRSPASDPARCRHRRFLRVGIQRAPMPPYCLYLLTCRDCGTTLTTQTVRSRRDAGKPPAPATALEEDLAGARKRRRAG